MCVCEGFYIQTQLYAARSCAMRFMVVSCLGKHLQSSMSKITYCSVQLSFMTAVFAVGEGGQHNTRPNSFLGYHTQTLSSHFLLVTWILIFFFSAYTYLLETYLSWLRLLHLWKAIYNIIGCFLINYIPHWLKVLFFCLESYELSSQVSAKS